MFWISIIPLIITLAVGTKLQAIIATMALEIKERHAVVQGIPLVQLSDHHFWFSRPHLVLFLIHFTLFQNAFQIIYFLWIWYEFGLNSCFHDDVKYIIARICLGVGVQVLCSYITLPLYALVSQMGSHMKKSIFDEQTSKALKKWTQAAKKKNVKGDSPSRSPATSPKGSPKAAAAIPLHRFKTTGHAGLTSAPSRRRNHSDQDMSAVEADVPASSSTATLNPAANHADLLTGSTEHKVRVEEKNKDEFSLVDL